MKCRIEHTKCENYESGCILEWPKCKYQTVLPGNHRMGIVKFSGVFNPKIDRIPESTRSRPIDVICRPNQRIYNLESETPIYTSVSGCTKCGKVFRSPTGFDEHRVGPYTDRRCLTTEELVGIGMCKNTQGQWSKPWE